MGFVSGLIFKYIFGKCKYLELHGSAVNSCTDTFNASNSYVMLWQSVVCVFCT